MRKRDVEYLGPLGYDQHLWRSRKNHTEFFVMMRTLTDDFKGLRVYWSFVVPKKHKKHVSQLRPFYDCSINTQVIRIGCKRFSRPLVDAVIKNYRLPLKVERRRKR